MAHYYEVHGLCLRSYLVLPELEAQRKENGCSADLTVTLRPDPVTEFQGGSDIRVESQRAAFRIEGVGHYDIRVGKEIAVSPEPGADPAAIRLFLLGSALGLALHQRGSLLLHASAVAIDGMAIAFMGDQGEGKSTLAAHCVIHEGAKLVGDDTLVVSFDGEGRPWAQPGIPVLKLWRDALQSLDTPTTGLRPDWYRAEKFHWPQSDSFSARPHPLREVLVLADDRQAGTGCISRITGSLAAVAIIDNTYRVEHLDDLRQRAIHFDACMRLANRIPVSRFARERRPSNIREMARLVVSHFRMGHVA